MMLVVFEAILENTYFTCKIAVEIIEICTILGSISYFVELHHQLHDFR